MDEKARILIVDDESDIRKVIRLLLEKKGYEILEACDGVVAVENIKQNSVDLIIMDIMMPNMSGIAATSEIRKISLLPILFLTAKSLDSDKERAYLSGGDDYLVKPFSSSELLLKVDSLLRRYMIYKGKQDMSDNVSLPCGVTLDPKNREAYKNGILIDLRDREADILFYLYEHRGEVVETKNLYESVWGEAPLSSGPNNVMVNMLNLRKKLEDDPSLPKVIKTVWGKGYLIDK